MLKEYLMSQSGSSTHWSDSVPGTRVCRFALQDPGREALHPVPVCGEPLQFETLFLPNRSSCCPTAAGKTAAVGMCASGSFNVLGNDGRCSIIGVDSNIDTSTHGNEASFEFIVEKAPDYIFVMDRDAAIGTEGAQLAQEIIENELVMDTEAYKNGNIVYLAHPTVWYTAEGGITALDLMLQDLESELLE